MVSTRRRYGLVACILLLTLGLSGPALAQATRTWVSGVGDDANPCSRTAPCKSFAGAISKTAEWGEINALDPAGFGTLTITKSIIIDGSTGPVADITTSMGNGININADPTDRVILRNLSFNGLTQAGSGIRIVRAGAVVIENVTVDNFANYGIEILTNNENSSADTTLVTLRDVRITNSGGGVLVAPSTTASPPSFVELLAERVSVDGGTYGLRVQGNVTATVRSSSIQATTQDGFAVFTGPKPAALTVVDSVSVNNGRDGLRVQGAGGHARISGSTFTGNIGGVRAFLSGTITSFGNNAVDGNSVDGGPTAAEPLV